jgi:hypothetical protein
MLIIPPLVATPEKADHSQNLHATKYSFLISGHIPHCDPCTLSQTCICKICTTRNDRYHQDVTAGNHPHAIAGYPRRISSFAQKIALVNPLREWSICSYNRKMPLSFLTSRKTNAAVICLLAPTLQKCWPHAFPPRVTTSIPRSTFYELYSRNYTELHTHC